MLFLTGSGYSSIITNILVYAYYCIIVTYPMMFLYYSFSSEVPWASCDNSWNTPDCYQVCTHKRYLHYTYTILSRLVAGRLLCNCFLFLYLPILCSCMLIMMRCPFDPIIVEGVTSL